MQVEQAFRDRKSEEIKVMTYIPILISDWINVKNVFWLTNTMASRWTKETNDLLLYSSPLDASCVAATWITSYENHVIAVASHATEVIF